MLGKSMNWSEQFYLTWRYRENFCFILFISIPNRHMQEVRRHIRSAEIFVFIFTLMVVVFDILPAFDHFLPLLLWLPFDPYKNTFSYVFAYIYEVSCTSVATAVCLSTNMYMYVVLICLNFNYILLGERAKRVGYSNGMDSNGIDSNRSTQSKVSVYGDMTDLIKLHLKMNQ